MMDLASTLKRLVAGSMFSIPSGVYSGDLHLLVPHITLRASGGPVTIQLGHSYGLKVEADDVTLEGITFARNGGHGLFLARANGGPIEKVTLRNVISDQNAVNGILTNNVHQFTAENVKCRGNRDGHGLYLSQHGSVYRVAGGEFKSNHRTGIHVNAHKGHAEDVEITGADCRDNPTASIQIAGVTKGKLAGNQVGGGHSDIVLWTDNGGKDYAPLDWDCTGQPGRYLVSKWSLKTCRLPPGVSPGRPEGE